MGRKDKQVNIALMGFEFDNANKGCAALSYSFLQALLEILQGPKISVVNISYQDNLGFVPEYFSNIDFKNFKVEEMKSAKYYKSLNEIFRWADFIFDITYGDSFSDIYGKKWLVRTNINKTVAVKYKSKFILMPQTYGPFNSNILKVWSAWIIKKAKRVYSRDQSSITYLEQLGIKDVVLTTDLAMALPYNKEDYSVSKDKINVGINISSLLWNNGFTGQNEFELTVNYQQYCNELIEKLLEKDIYRIYFIPHVIDDREGARENDLRPIRILHERFNATVLPPDFKTPIEIKSYISNMDVFIGARMHSTIAAFSSGVATIPFAYSRKFNGLYNSLGYPYIIDGKREDTNNAVNMTLEYVENKEMLLDASSESMIRVKSKLKDFLKDLTVQMNRYTNT